MSLVFRKCKIEDLNSLVEISKITFITAFEADNDPTDFNTYIEEAFSPRRIEKELLNPDSAFYFVYKENNLVGYLKLNSGDAQTEQLDLEGMELERIYVLHEYQGQQIGRQMLDKTILLARKEQVEFLWLGVWEENKKAIRFYERYGFIKFGTHPYYIGTDKQTDWLMKYCFT